MEEELASIILRTSILLRHARAVNNPSALLITNALDNLREALRQLRTAQQPAEPDASPEAGAENSSSAPARAG